jgi:predicted Zn-dependent peptidase
MNRKLAALLGALALAGGAARAADPAAPFAVPVDDSKLANGLRVVLSPDHTSPLAVVALYYRIGFRTEPRDRTGFAHLFEHMMFQGSENLGKMEFIRLVQANGGVFNGSTRFDFTNYFEAVPSHALEIALWAEADRMKGLAIDAENLKNQQEVVKNEVRVNVLNRPYGGFPWLDLPQHANVNWYNAHNFYGDLEDLDAATLEDVSSFFRTYYAPNNAVLVVVGDFDPATTKAWIEKYFGSIPAAELPAPADISEPRQEAERRASKDDPLATRPALAVGYHAPPRDSKHYFAMGLLDQILVQGADSRLHRALVQEHGLTGEVAGGINSGLGDMYNIGGPTLWDVSLFHDAGTSTERILEVFDAEIEKLRTAPVDRATLDRAVVKARSSLYEYMEGLGGFGKVDLLASFALFDDDPGRINRIEEELRAVTPELLLETAREYLRKDNRTVLVVVPKAEAAAGERSGS